MPGDPERQHLRDLIGALAKRHKAPAFEPHITLLGGVSESPDAALEKVRHIASQTAAFKVRLSRAAYLERYYRCVFMEIDEELALLHLQKSALSQFGAPDTAYQPHLSLLYGDFDAELKQQLVQEFTPYNDTAVNVSALALWAMDEHVANWREEAKFALASPA